LVFVVGEFLEAGNARLALGLAALGVLAHPLQFLLQSLGTGFLALLLGLQAGLLLVQPGAVVALVGNAVAAVQFENPLGRVVQEVAIVGDGHHGAGEAVQELLQPVHRLGIQVVGGFVEQQHVGLGQKQAAQRDAALFATGQQADLGLPGRQSQGVGGDLELVLGIGASRGDHGFQAGLLGGQGVEIGIGLGISGVHLFELGLGGKHFAHGLFHALADGVLVVELGFLGQVADLDPGHGDGFAFDFLVHAGHDLQQGGFARAVQAQHANLGAGEEAQGDVFQDLPLGRHGLGDAVHRINVLGHWVLTWGMGQKNFCVQMPIIGPCDNMPRDGLQLPAASAHCWGRKKHPASGLPILNLIGLRLAQQPPVARQADTQRPGRAHPKT